MSYLHESFQLGRSVVRGTVCHRLVVRVLNKSHLMYFGRAEQNCDCPYKVSGLTLGQKQRNPCGSLRLTRSGFVACVQAVIQVCDHTGSVCVVLWNSVCVSWYRRLNPGDIISLSHYRVKKRFEAQSQDIGAVPNLVALLIKDHILNKLNQMNQNQVKRPLRHIGIEDVLVVEEERLHLSHIRDICMIQQHSLESEVNFNEEVIYTGNQQMLVSMQKCEFLCFFICKNTDK